MMLKLPSWEISTFFPSALISSAYLVDDGFLFALFKVKILERSILFISACIWITLIDHFTTHRPQATDIARGGGITSLLSN